MDTELSLYILMFSYIRCPDICHFRVNKYQGHIFDEGSQLQDLQMFFSPVYVTAASVKHCLLLIF
jgi:cytochrome oxidase Cu insertion factor (SCO1/SenC/PrrC family)